MRTRSASGAMPSTVGKWSSLNRQTTVQPSRVCDVADNRLALKCTALAIVTSLMDWNMVIATLGLCCANMFYQEDLLKNANESQNFISITQHVFIVLSCLLLGIPLHRRSSVPVSRYSLMACFNLAQWCAHNYAHSFHVPMPMQIIFKSSSLIANLVLGLTLYKRRYATSKYFATIIITVGLILVTRATHSVASKRVEQASANSIDTYVGVVFITASLFMSALMGFQQENLAKEYSDYNPLEGLFFSHALVLPFLVFYPSNFGHFWKVFTSTQLYHPSVGSARLVDSLLRTLGLHTISPLFVKLIINNVLQLACIMSVFQLIARFDSFTTTLVLTLRKFVSLIISIFYFGHPFTLTHWLGTLVVFVGLLSYSLQGQWNSQPKCKKNKKH